MARNSYVLAGLAIGFAVVLLHATLRSTSTPLGQARKDHAAATRECQRALRESVADARFPFEANVTDLPSDQLQLTGSMDSGSGLEAERRNYVCFVSPHTASGGYVADSVEVWKSH
jgi:hypothetical protein